MITRTTESIRAFLARRAPEAGNADAHARAVAALAGRPAVGLLAREAELAPKIAAAHNFSAGEARRALRAALEPLQAARLMGLWETEGGPELRAGGRRPGLTVVFGGGVIPQPTARAVVAAAMASERVLYRPPAGDPLVAVWLIEEMARLDEAAAAGRRVGFRERVIAATWPREEAGLTREIIQAADAVVLFGDGATVEALRAMGRAGTRWFVYGPRVSLAVIAPEGMDGPWLEEAAGDLAEDIVAYNQLGCLSPAALVMIGGDATANAEFRRMLAEAIEARAREGGAMPLPPAGAALAIQTVRAIGAMRGECEASEGLPGWTLVRDAERRRALHEPTPGYQTLFIHERESWEELARELEQTCRDRIQCIAIEAADEVGAEFEARLARSGVSRVCGFGQMQSPPLEWAHDGNPFFPL